MDSMEKMNSYEIVFLNSPIYAQSVDDGEDYLPPLGQGYIVTQLEQAGINVKLIDCVNEKWGVKEVAEFINEGKFPNVALNVFSVNLDIVKSIVENVNRKINWYFGGKAMRFLWSTMLSWPWNDNKVIYTIGECDSIYTDLLREECIESPIYQQLNQRVYLVDKYSKYYPQNLDKYTLNRKLFKNRSIINHYGRIEECIITSRECIYNCAFCGGARYANCDTTVRNRSSENVISEIEEITAMNPKVNSIRVLDDLFLKNRSSIIEAVKIFEKFPEMHWRGMAHVKSFLGNLDLINQLKCSGCDELFVGIESGSSKVRKQIHKVGTVEEVRKVIRNLLEAGIDVKGYFICGFPNENKKQMEETVQLANILKLYAENSKGNFRTTAFQFRPYHGTELYDYLIRTGKVIENYHMTDNTSSKKQYSFITENYSVVDDKLLKQFIEKICKKRED